MKTLFFKNMLPIVIVILGISGAFANKSMSSLPRYVAPETGYTRDPSGHCTDIDVLCNNTPSAFLCRLYGTSGPQAYGIDPTTHDCLKVLYRP
ncbi:DUF6520 family protein [Flavobacterium pectinovorum]|uniref:DUF6520 family protein n=1 Tax=Flavobacterium pectinovorum TaxID=29533 RepID=UPI0019D61B8D|nr:DUF6520 family protein [Flavobacterium pectinovorum]